MSAADRLLEELPGADLVLRGLEDLAGTRATPEATLVEVARSRLRSLGLTIPETPTAQVDAELRLYERLGARYPDRDPYAVYCAWLEQLDSFVCALTQLRERTGELDSNLVGRPVIGSRSRPGAPRNRRPT